MDRRQATGATLGQRGRVQLLAALRRLFRLTDRGSFVAPGVLGCAYPRTERALTALSEREVRLLINLHGRAHDPGLLARYGMREIHLPVRDFAAPMQSQIERGVDAILDARSEDEMVAVHCGGGLGRTGTLLACYLLATDESLEADEAISRVRDLRPGSVETRSQVAAVEEWARRSHHTV